MTAIDRDQRSRGLKAPRGKSAGVGLLPGKFAQQAWLPSLASYRPVGPSGDRRIRFRPPQSAASACMSTTLCTLCTDLQPSMRSTAEARARAKARAPQGPGQKPVPHAPLNGVRADGVPARDGLRQERGCSRVRRWRWRWRWGQGQEQEMEMRQGQEPLTCRSSSLRGDQQRSKPLIFSLKSFVVIMPLTCRSSSLRGK